MKYTIISQVRSLVLISILSLSLAPCTLLAGNGVPNVFYTQQDSVEAATLLERSKSASNSGDFDLALQLVQQAENIYQSRDDDEGIAKSLTYKADILIDQQLLDKANDIMVQALRDFSGTTQVAQMHNLLGTIYSIRENPLMAAEKFNTAMQYLDRLPESESDRLRAGLLHNLAVIYGDMGQFDDAYKNYLKSIEYARTVGDSVLLSVAYNNLGMAYSQNDEYEKSKYYLEQSLELARDRNSQIDIYRAHLNLANTLGNTGEYETALFNYDRAQEALSAIRPGQSSPIIMHNRGATLAIMGRYEEAEDLLFQSLKFSNEQGINEGIYHNNFVLGKMYAEQDRYEEAIAYYKSAEAVVQSLYNITLNLEVADALQQVYAENGNYRDAYEQLKSYSSLSDSLNEIERDQELANAESLLELERQNEINNLLQEKQASQEQQLRNQLIIIIAGILVILLISILLYQMKRSSREKEKIYDQLLKQKKELEELNKSKDKLFAIISHDLRSPLMSMQGLLSLIKEDFLSQDDLKDMVPELEASLQENSNVMEDLLAWAKEQLSGVEVNLRPVLLIDLAEEVIQSQKFIAEKKKIDVILDINESTNVLADYNALSLVIRNLISNAIKFSEPGGKIVVSDNHAGEVIVISVKDTGIGIPENAHNKIFQNNTWTREGTHNEKGTGFGLSLSKEFVERMNGRIWFESSEGKGSEFFVEIPSAS